LLLLTISFVKEYSINIIGRYTHICILSATMRQLTNEKICSAVEIQNIILLTLLIKI